MLKLILIELFFYQTPPVRSVTPRIIERITTTSNVLRSKIKRNCWELHFHALSFYFTPPHWKSCCKVEGQCFSYNKTTLRVTIVYMFIKQNDMSCTNLVSSIIFVYSLPGVMDVQGCMRMCENHAHIKIQFVMNETYI